MPFVDTHCHLEEVLQEVRRRQVAPSLNKEPKDLTEEEVTLWRAVGWMPEAELVVDSFGDGPRGVWQKRWSQLSNSQRSAASQLGYKEISWNQNRWLLPKDRKWEDFDADTRRALQVLGETQTSWDGWSSTWSWSTQKGDEGLDDAFLARMQALNDERKWRDLSLAQRQAAVALGFTEQTWQWEEMADVHSVLDTVFGEGFEWCITQGCDADTFETAQQLALSHPKIFVSFGCHPKAAWSYDADFEARMLACIRACGKKVVGFGEFGLDFSHPYFGPNEENRQRQREVFARQLQLAVSLSMTLVIHSREAETDTLELMRAAVPEAYKVHLHSYRGSVPFMKQLLTEWTQMFIGMPGLVTMDDEHAKELVRQCPLDRMVIETDAPYLPVQGHWLSHPGLLPEVMAAIAELKGLDIWSVATTMRENARVLYGI